MDEWLRNQAQEHVDTAKKLGSVFTENYLKKAIECLEQIQNKTVDDYQLFYRTNFKLATYYFNQLNYNAAANCYRKGIDCLHRLPANDNVYRLLMREYINLSDCFIELRDPTASGTAIEYAKKAFILIEEKNADEIAIGDPDSNFESFYSYIQRQVSQQSYRTSVSFRNNRSVHLAGQQDMRCLSDLSRLTFMGKKEQENRDSQEKNAFSSIVSKSSTSDYRILLKQYWAMAQEYSCKQQAAEVRETFKQIKDTLYKIDPSVRTKHERDILVQIENSRAINGQSNLATLLTQYSADVFSEDAAGYDGDMEVEDIEEEEEDNIYTL